MKLFVYGTLKRGYSNHFLLIEHHAKFLGEDKVQGYGVYGNLPLAGPSKNTILDGEVYDDISPELWDILDVIEHAYNREIITTENGHEAVMFISKYMPSILGRIPPFKIHSHWPNDHYWRTQ